MTQIFDRIGKYNPAKSLLDGKTILITGAAAGIGREVSISLARHGAATILLDKSESGLNDLYDLIIKKDYPSPILVTLDLATASETICTDIVTQIADEFGKLDGLIHNAAELGPLTPMHLYNLDAWSKVMRVNFYIPYLLTRACWPLFQHAESASILFTTSQQARNGKAYWGAYGVAGAAVENMVATWSQETENSDLRFNTIDPGPTQTDFRNRSYPGDALNREIKGPETLSQAYLYLMSSESKHQRGQQFTVTDQLQLLAKASVAT